MIPLQARCGLEGG